ncbi:MAG TPA: glycosyltransferase [Jatrophihabitans sp.]|nr:glycosyltransferase [Jatrophihabitans sp.]
MTHVLLVVENLPLARDHRLRKQVAALAGAGCRVSVICRADPQNATVPDVAVREYRAPIDGHSPLGFLREYGYSLLAARRLIRRTHARDPFAAIQISGTPDLYFAIAAPLRRAGVRLVFDQRDLSPELYELRYGRRDAAYRTLLRLERASYRAADHVITVNRSLERVAYERGGVAPGGVTIVGNGPSRDAGRDAVPRPVLKHGRRLLCCWIGVMGPQDRVDVALRAVAVLVHERGRTDTHFAFVGDGESRGAAQQLATDLGLGDYTSFPGWLPEHDVHAYLATADVGLEPNLEEIVSPVKVMEYMAFGVPFAAFDLAETRLLSGDAGVYAPPGDTRTLAAHLDDLLDDDARRAALGRCGRQRVLDELCWERQAARYVDVYRELLSASPSPLSRPSEQMGVL